MSDLRAYIINIDGYEPCRVLAANAGKARYVAFRRWHDAGLPGSFGDFVNRSSILCLGSRSEAREAGRQLVQAVLGGDEP